MRQTIFAVSMLLLALTYAYGATSDEILEGVESKSATTSVPALGRGVNESSRQVMENISIDLNKAGVVVEQEIQQGALNLTWTADLKSGRKVFSADVSAGVDYGIFNINAEAGVGASDMSTSLNKTYTMVYDLKVREYTIDGIINHPNQLTEKAQDALTGPYNKFVEAYGTGFISQITVGAKLIGVLNFSFENLQVARSFNATAKGGITNGIFSVETAGAVKAMDETLKNKIVVSMSIRQVGGNPGELLDSIRTTLPGGNITGAVDDVMNKFVECQEILTNAAAKLAQSLREPNPNLAVVEYKTREYEPTLFVTQSKLDRNDAQKILDYGNRIVSGLTLIDGINNVTTLKLEGGVQKSLLPASDILTWYGGFKVRTELLSHLRDDINDALSKTTSTDALAALDRLKKEVANRKSEKYGYSIRSKDVSLKDVIELIHFIRENTWISLVGPDIDSALGNGASAFYTAKGQPDARTIPLKNTSISQHWTPAQAAKEIGQEKGLNIGGTPDNPMIRFGAPWDFVSDNPGVTPLYAGCSYPRLDSIQMGFMNKGYTNHTVTYIKNYEAVPGKGGAANGYIRACILEETGKIDVRNIYNVQFIPARFFGKEITAMRYVQRHNGDVIGLDGQGKIFNPEGDSASHPIDFAVNTNTGLSIVNDAAVYIDFLSEEWDKIAAPFKGWEEKGMHFVFYTNPHARNLGRTSLNYWDKVPDGINNLFHHQDQVDNGSVPIVYQYFIEMTKIWDKNGRLTDICLPGA